MNTDEKLSTAFMALVCLGSFGASLWNKMQDDKIPPRAIDQRAAYCTFDQHTHKVQIKDADKDIVLDERTIHKPFNARTVSISESTAPPYSDGTTYIVNFKQATCMVDKGRDEYVYALLSPLQFASRKPQ